MTRLLIILLLLSATAVHAQHYGPELPGDPELTVEYDFDWNRQRTPAGYQGFDPDFQGMYYSYMYTNEIYPVLPMVFFDSGSAEIPNRYVQFDSSDAQIFKDTRISGGTLQKYRQILNILGYRLRNYPHTSIRIAGYNSGEPGESRNLAAQRAKQVYVYLRTVWDIDPSRMTLLPGGDLPPIPSYTTDSLGRADNRRVEIYSDEWEIVRPIEQIWSVNNMWLGDTWIFHIRNGRSNEAIRHRTLEVRRWGRLLATIDADTADTELRVDVGSRALDSVVDWLRDRDGIMAADTAPIEVQLAVYDTEGRVWRSNTVQIPVRYINDACFRSHRTNYCIDRFSLVLFDFFKSELSSQQQRVLREYYVRDLKEIKDSLEVEVTVIGHNDAIGSEGETQRLTEQRARYVADILRSEVDLPAHVVMEVEGAGEMSPLYSNQFPEGRFYNRTVQVTMKFTCRNCD